MLAAGLQRGADSNRHGNLQPCIITPERLGYEVCLDKLLGLVGAEVQLESLPQGGRDLGHASPVAGHLRLPTHHADEVNDVIRGPSQGFESLLAFTSHQNQRGRSTLECLFTQVLEVIEILTPHAAKNVHVLVRQLERRRLKANRARRV